MPIILASASARRQEILRSLGIKFKVLVSDFTEEKIKIKDPENLVKKLALEKALAVKKKVKDKDYLIISADTIVALKEKGKWLVLNKPKNRKEAGKMLKLLSNKTHQVLTGFVLLNQQGKRLIGVVKTTVVFKELSCKMIEQYLDTKVFLDRAGAYGIQDPKCQFFKSFSGSYTNILGLPVEGLKKMLKEFTLKGGD